MDTTILEDIGLTGAEIKVFIALLELGSVNAGKVVEKSGLQNAVVHRAFHSLIEKGLITYIFEGKKKKYQAVEPKLLLDFIEEKKKRIQEVLPELEAKRATEEKKPTARMFWGTKGVKELLNLMIETEDKEYVGYGGSLISNKLLGKHFWLNFHKRRMEKAIQAKLLFHDSLGWWGKEIQKYGLTTVRTTQKDFEELSETVICGHRVGIILWVEKPIGVLIEEKLVADSYKKFFQILWNQNAMVYQGEEGVKTFFNDMLDYRDIYFIGGNYGIKRDFPVFWESYKKKRIEKKCFWHDLVDYECLGSDNLTDEPFYEEKVLPKELSSPHVIAFYGDKMANIIWKGNDTTIFVIEDSDIVKSYKNYFNLLWNQING